MRRALIAPLTTTLRQVRSLLAAEQVSIETLPLALKTAWRHGGIEAVKKALPRSHLLHIRVGLARPFGQPPDKCYVMVNGVHG